MQNPNLDVRSFARGRNDLQALSGDSSTGQSKHLQSIISHSGTSAADTTLTLPSTNSGADERFVSTTNDKSILGSSLPLSTKHQSTPKKKNKKGKNTIKPAIDSRRHVPRNMNARSYTDKSAWKTERADAYKRIQDKIKTSNAKSSNQTDTSTKAEILDGNGMFVSVSGFIDKQGMFLDRAE